MLNYLALKEIIANPKITQKDKVLACLAIDADRPKEIKEIKSIGQNSGFKGIASLNVADILSKHIGKTLKMPSGWDLTLAGKTYVKHLGGGQTVQLSSSLRIMMEKIPSIDTKSFVKEAIECFEAHQYRAAVVLSWAGAISVLYDYVIKNHLSNFNEAALIKDAKWKPAKNADDLARMKDINFLAVCENASIIGKSVRQELEACLVFRNGCGHPNTLKIGENRVSAHLETLILNIYSSFS